MNVVLRLLKRDGFIRVAGCNGTFVSDCPPHLCRYGIVFRGNPKGSVPQNWSNYWTLIEQEARSVATQRNLEVVSYYGITRHIDEPDYQRLVQDAAEGRLAGIFSVYPMGNDFSYNFPFFKGPKAAVSESAPANAFVLDNDRWGLVEKAARYFAARGRRRVAWIGEGQHEGLRALLRELRINGRSAAELFPDDIAVTLNASSRETADPIVRLLLRQAAAYRPDGLLVMDDHLIAPALRGLTESGVRIPDDLDVISHCNYPAVPASPLPIRWLGFDATDLVSRMFDFMHEGRSKKRGETGKAARDAGAPHMLSALWEEEWKAKKTQARAEASAVA
jgi:DNA-binding LacI/PurR family transcriptional regulator